MNYNHVLRFIDEIRMSQRINQKQIVLQSFDRKHLISQHALQTIFEENYRQGVERAVVFDIQNVVHLSNKHCQEGMVIDAEHFPNFRLPYPEIWAEYKPEDKSCHGLQAVGILCRDHNRATSMAKSLREANQREDMVTLEFTLFGKAHGTIFGPIATFAMRTDNDGVIHGMALLNSMDRRTYDIKRKAQVDQNGMAVIPMRPIMTPLQHDFILHLITPAMYAIQFMNCRNISQTVKEPPTTINERHQRKHKKPLVTYRVLKIDRNKAAANSTSGPAQNPGLNAYHFCRGHFKRFTAERPLLGRHVGTYWWEAQARGRRENGEVIKDYEVADAIPQDAGRRDVTGGGPESQP